MLGQVLYFAVMASYTCLMDMPSGFYLNRHTAALCASDLCLFATRSLTRLCWMADRVGRICSRFGLGCVVPAVTVVMVFVASQWQQDRTVCCDPDIAQWGILARCILLCLLCLKTTTYRPAYNLVGGVLGSKSGQNHGLRNVETGSGVGNLHGLIDLLWIRSTLLWHAGQQGV
jgi:hypothetical protein